MMTWLGEFPKHSNILLIYGGNCQVNYVEVYKAIIILQQKGGMGCTCPTGPGSGIFRTYIREYMYMLTLN